MRSSMTPLPDQGHYEDCVSDTVAKDGNVDWHIWLPAMTSPNKDDMSLAGRSWSWFSGRCGIESLQGFCSSWRDVPDCHESGTRCVPDKVRRGYIQCSNITGLGPSKLEDDLWRSVVPGGD